MVVGRGFGPVGDLGGQRLDVGLDAGDHLGGLVDVAGDLAELVDLFVGVGEGHRGGQREHVGADGLEPGFEVVGPTRDHDEVGLVGGDRLDVRLVGREVGRRHLGGEVGLVVDGDDLVAGADGEEHLRRRRRQRDDALGPIVRACRRARRRRLGGCGAGLGRLVVVAARGEQRGRGEQDQCGSTGVHSVRFLLSVEGWTTLDDRVTAVRTAPLLGAGSSRRGQATWLAPGPSPGDSQLRDSAGFAPASLTRGRRRHRTPDELGPATPACRQSLAPVRCGSAVGP